MAAGQGFKTFATGDVLTAADTNGYLMQGIWVFANATARDAAVTSPQEGNACYLKDTDNIMVYSGSAWVTKSSSAAGGKVLQVIQATSTSSVTSSSATLADTGLSATITPSATSSKVLIMTTQQFYKGPGSASNAIKTALLRGATNIAQMSTDLLATDSAVFNLGTMAYHYLDSPSTTSATTYKVQFASRSGTSLVGLNNNPDLQTMILMEIGA